MFTGIIETTGILTSRQYHEEDQSLTFHSEHFNFSHCQIGDSIAVNGVCLTVIALDAQSFTADVSVETLSLTTLGTLEIGDSVNLEKALTPSTPLGGHLVSGHVDGIGILLERFSDARSERLTFEAPKEISRYIAKKGSITIDGVSLTVNQVEHQQFSVNIVPHTLERTTLKNYQIGQQVNLEADLIARYIERLIQADNENLTVEKLISYGF
ncbi:riboflavin synthase [Suttonella ornithocola]|uniref:Riboflavin synthase n=1 Tax=Suttonella ornithocola TaxID=279832 RepID=A0A380MX31_9GAMM|nr:riboflavin synthase [Suttonella ornithocola]SUO97160.1 Riboflavin synthase alpha chain [Suttonella ornithocola]